MAESSERVSAAPEIVYDDGTVLVCVKPAGVLSTDEPGGLPGLLRERLGDEKTDLRTVHRPPHSAARSGRGASKRNTWLWCTARPRTATPCGI